MAFMNGKLRYQACNNKECLPPRTVDVRVTLGYSVKALER